MTMERPILLALALVGLLGGCAVKTLKAPCSRDEGPAPVRMAYSSLAAGKAAEPDECGPMKFVNEPPVGKGRVGRVQGSANPSPGRVVP